MALKTTPGKLITDGKAFVDIENELKTFVNDTEILNIGLDNFQLDNTPFVISQSEAPSVLTSGQMWFNRTDGRLYSYFTQGISGASYANSLNSCGVTFVRNSFVMEPSHWVAVSDRKEIYAIYQTVSSQSEPDDAKNLLPYGTVALGAGRLKKNASQVWSDYGNEFAPRVWEGAGNPVRVGNLSVDLWSPGDDFAGCGLRDAIGSKSCKLFLHTTNHTIPSRTMYGGVFHELGYRRTLSGLVVRGPGYGFVGGRPMGTVSTEVRGISHDTPAGDNPYDTNSATPAFGGYITESGPSHVYAAGPSTELPYTHHVFWFAATPKAMFVSTN